MTTSTEPITVTISHRLGRDEAKRRLENGLSTIRTELGAYVKSLDYSWDGYTLSFRVSALMQTITGRIEVYEEFVRVELGLPALLRMAAKRIIGHIESRGATLLEGPKAKT
jgi:Putative polyhydroxyalkanoic acid system protein (PHA_gran_rgn)